ncbi:hypothetical protein QAD02_023882 [Eretmocerus hayati]|uniref:Uncharacterized protein n=1 Tax=Eretmocerus hayati TaxID=131215 RepID=A0ACC2PX93_9HYME|nr:hypothetical protein QAD02_023882 [Eretmocerus hayati]
MSEAGRLKRKARRNLHRVRVRARKRLEYRNLDTRAPVPAHPDSPVRPHCKVSQESDDDCRVISNVESWVEFEKLYRDLRKKTVDDGVGEQWKVPPHITVDERARLKNERQSAQNRHQEVPEGSLRYNEPHRRKARCVRETSRAPSSETRREGRPGGAAVGQEAAALARQVSSKGASRLLSCNGLHSQKESDLIFRRQKKIELTDERTRGLEEEESTPSQLPPSTHPDTGSRVISSPCDQLSDIDAGIKQAEDLVDEVVKTTLNHLNSLLQARTIFRIKKEIIVAMKMDVEFFKDGGPLPPGPLQKKYRAGYVRRF